ncbi:TetR/AcrR family transcriptional regulator [Parvularcula sp. LCG005]|uniref:TetR/AcrR family transcriptional regulator n=1 Tax=Parvularcula sp. LCG005 TaxID=3078805 RepID=UPI002942CE92|nr:TetR/AcrR family transcriptional regulator [Parvularcula sp. LCG005]WOI54123.1 TetR/AcrR family transcriptional regulator [Parvularcula sp. LCG005]
MARTTSPRRTTEDLRASALDEARALLIEGGPEQVKARVLAVRMGVSVGTVYNLFGHLDELLFHVGGQVYDELLEIISAAREQARRENLSTTDQLLALGRAYLNFVVDRQDLWSAVLAFNRRGKSQVPVWYLEKQRALFEVLESVIVEAKGHVDSPKHRTLTKALWAAVHGIITISVGPTGLSGTQDEVWAQIDLIVRAVARDLGDA